MPKKLKTYAEKDTKSKKRYLNLYEKVIKSGKSIDAIKRMTRKTYNKTFGLKVGSKRSLKAQHYVLNQIKRDASYVCNDYLKKENIQNSDLKASYFNTTNKVFNIEADEVIADEINVIRYEPLEQEGQYGTVIITDYKDNKDYYIKYDDEKSFKKQLDKLLKKYEITNYKMRISSLRMYKTYLTDEFNERLDSYGVS